MFAIECLGVTKAFGATPVVDAVSLNIPTGTVHSLVGANGAGKSTLLGMMSGRLRPTSGTIDILGSRIHGAKPREAINAGLSAVYQELTIVPGMTACENVFLGQEIKRGVFVDKKAIHNRYLELTSDFGIAVAPDTIARSLTVANAQMLEILRAVQANARVILFDEPTAALSERERRSFLDLVSRLKRAGKTIVLVTHNLDEVLEISDDITIMRSGRKVSTGPAAEWTKARIVHEMTGEALQIDVLRDAVCSDLPFALEVSDLNLPGAVANVNLRVRRGEVLGLAGLVGAGRSSILRSIAGAERHSTGRLSIHGVVRPWPKSVRTAIRKGKIGLIPEERKREGVVLNMSLPDNVTMSDFSKVTRLNLVRRDLQMRRSQELLAPLALSKQVGAYSVGSLSGGNQQKVVLAKWFHRDVDILLVDEPTRGIDVGAKLEVLKAIRALAREGKAIVITSAETEEVLSISDRVLVVAEGRIVNEYDMHKQSPTVKDVLDDAFGVQR